MKHIVTLLLWLIVAAGTAGVILLKEYTLYGCGLLLAAYVAMRWLCNRWDFDKEDSKEGN